jgi:ParB family chromosome partitioning protein|tara:strand:+ start:81 stop:563 length:483 start_codon:yes stop_codon:yes gene_type:complete
MKIKSIETNKILPYINNPRKNLNIDKVASSIKEFGFQQPIVIDKNNIIIVGHTRFEAAKKLGLKEVPVQVADLNENQSKAYRIADNRLNGDSRWDNQLLNIEVKDLLENNINIELLGFNPGELDTLLTEVNINEENENFEEISEPLKTKNQCPSCGYEWD